MSEIILLSDPAVAAVPVAECGEPLVDLRTVRALRMDDRFAGADGAYARVRLGVADRLVNAQTLLPAGIRLLVLEGHRPAAAQERLFAAAVARLRAERPDADDAWLRGAAAVHHAPPALAPHVTGGAVDLTLVGRDGAPLWMGSLVHDPDPAHCPTGCDGVVGDARGHRDLLTGAMRRAGLVNYAAQWWHWSYGDRYWAHLTGAPAARYGEVS
ncbi:M15 family metallopeptidase [Catellatospora bangladeshensis]|uniref:D-alanyl-D-alanine dipeptidase n=1 Tax=Catellatospora bangladeshensis TaxID=310355 RepID=A0A8J3NL12_9ACTN|nr:M15 family metallopeptidase [Catellatospora bangladeshensis]GIF83291.1 D-alanyl-D-alanine dipeptidase [Catellatospora bangladeshensis]